MCVKCGQAAQLLREAGYSDDFREHFFWEHTAFPAGDNTLERVRAFLRVKPRKRKAWMRRDYEKGEAMMASFDREHPWDAMSRQRAAARAEGEAPHA